MSELEAALMDDLEDVIDERNEARALASEMMETCANLRAQNAELLETLERAEMWLSTVPQGDAMMRVCRAAITKAREG